MQYFKEYFEKIKSVPLEQITEHSHRSALQSLLDTIAKNTNDNIEILHEPKRKGKFGAPDFKISNDKGIIGYIENKKIGENLEIIIKTEQIQKYRQLSDNILLTNYLDFIWIKADNIQKATLGNVFDLENQKFQLKKENIQDVEHLIENFFSQAPLGIATAHDLAVALAVRAKNLKDFLQEELAFQKKQNSEGLLFGLYETFQQYIFTDLSISDFADAFAQMLVYGLFQAKLNADTKTVTLFNAKKFIPQSFRLIYELVGFLDELNKREYVNAKWIINEVISLLNNIDLQALRETLLFSKTVKDSENIDTDPYIYFYETFLAVYDENLRKAKGVYYTPPQVVNFIVSSIDNILQNTFKINMGLADRQKVTVLDFATGTGTFLIEIFKQILNNIPKNSQTKKDMIISEHILKNIYGFEYLIAPYTIAHLKLAQFLKEQNYEIKAGERLQVFLTNTLEPTDPQVKIPLLPALTKEARSAQAIKDKPILVITGNPPYSGRSQNTGEWISNLLRGNDIYAKEKTEKQANYFKIDGKPLEERNPKWLQDDYVKFIRFAQYKIDRAGQGVVGIITNHSFLDNPTFRGMRKSLMETFDQMYFIDLHGNSRKKEKTPEGKADQNVFDIMQGVCISLLIKKKGLKKAIYHTDFWGTRQDKFEQCQNNNLQTIEWQEVTPSQPFYLFKPQNKVLKEKYYKFWKITDIFNVFGTGIITKRDNLVIDSDKTNLLKKIIFFADENNSNEKVAHYFQIPLRDKDKWILSEARKYIQKTSVLEEKVKKIHYRPFDIKYIYWDELLIARLTNKITKHFINKKNIGLVISRQTKLNNFSHIFVADKIIDLHLLGNDSYMCPLYLYQQNGDSNGNIFLFKDDEKKDNFTKEFKEFIKTKYSKKTVSEEEKFKLQEKIKLKEQSIKNLQTTIKSFEATGNNVETIKILKQEQSKVENQIKKLKEQLQQAETTTYEPSPEEIMGYIYAVLHSETFRNTYAEFLKIDFPRVPFVEELDVFKKLSKAGQELIEVHLQHKKPDNYQDFGLYKGNGNNIVDKIEYKDNKLFINKTQFFDNIPTEVYNFYIGGYKILNKYLKYRTNKALQLDEIENIENIVRIILWTIEQKNKIDEILTYDLLTER